MSRLLLREIFRVAHSGLEKIALACAAFGLMHTAARASEPTKPSQSIEDPWLNPAAPQTLAASDQWRGAVATPVAHDDPWSALAPKRVASNAPVVRAAETEHAPVVPVAPGGLAMDSSDWDTKPRGRAPGLIASSDTWRSRQDVSAGVAETEPAPDTRVAPASPARTTHRVSMTHGPHRSQPRTLLPRTLRCPSIQPASGPHPVLPMPGPRVSASRCGLTLRRSRTICPLPPFKHPTDLCTVFGDEPVENCLTIAARC